MEEDSIDGIYNTLKTALKFQSAGGIGLSMHNIRAIQALASVEQTEHPMVSKLMLRVFNDTARYVDQGGGKRKGSSRFILNHGMPIFWFSWIEENHERKNPRTWSVLLLCGFWSVHGARRSKWRMEPVLSGMKRPVSTNVTEKIPRTVYTRYEQEGQHANRSCTGTWFAILNHKSK